MKKSMKNIIKYIATLSLVAMIGLAYGQQISETQAKAEEELFELQQIDKKSLTKVEKKALKRKIKRLKYVIRQEEERAAYDRYVERVRRWGPPAYAFGSPYLYDRFGYPVYSSRFISPYIQRPVVIVRRRPVCRYPAVRP